MAVCHAKSTTVAPNSTHALRPPISRPGSHRSLPQRGLPEPVRGTTARGHYAPATCAATCAITLIDETINAIATRPADNMISSDKPTTSDTNKAMSNGCPTEVERPGSGYGGSVSRVSPVWARNPLMRSGRYWIRLSRLRTTVARWSTLRTIRLPRPFFMLAHTPSTGLSSGA